MRETFVLNDIFCCPGFQHRVADAGQRGIAVLVVDTSEGIRFRLQSRGIAFDDVKKFGPMPNAPDVNINVSCETGLQYCPFCGRKLQDLVAANPDEFRRLSAEHAKFLDDWGV